MTKTPLPHQDNNELFSAEIHKRHTLFSGTHVVQTRYYGNAKVLAVVVRTGKFMVIFTFTYPLFKGVTGAPQVTLQPVSTRLSLVDLQNRNLW